MSRNGLRKYEAGVLRLQHRNYKLDHNQKGPWNSLIENSQQCHQLSRHTRFSLSFGLKRLQTLRDKVIFTVPGMLKAFLKIKTKL